jgi:penicillin G amidase
MRSDSPGTMYAALVRACRGWSERPWLGLVYGVAAFMLATWLARRDASESAKLLAAALRTAPRRLQDRPLPGLGAEVRVRLDAFGRPTIRARTRHDAFLALGYLCARDRMFQMDFLRREAAGRLSEILGPAVVESDRRMRAFDFQRVATEAARALPAGQAELTAAFADGVNAWLEADGSFFEREWLRYAPAAWRPSDSLLIQLGMFHRLCADKRSKRSLEVLGAALPPSVVRFFTPDSDCFDAPLIGGEGHRPQTPIPLEDLFQALASSGGSPWPDRGVMPESAAVHGSNAWAVSGGRTKDGRAIVANDLHLSLAFPNIFYCAAFEIEDACFSGVLVPGVPVVLAGSNRKVAWGVSNLCGDNFDLVPVEIHPDRGDTYKCDGQWRRFAHRREVIAVKGAPSIELEVRETVWGPVCEDRIAGRYFAIRWAALDPRASDMGLSAVAAANDVASAVAAASHAGCPPLNFVCADSAGGIAWTVAGKLPCRPGLGYIPGGSLPVVLNPVSGVIVTANNRVSGTDYAQALGQNFCNGYRAFRARELLEAQAGIDEAYIGASQLDMEEGGLAFYRTLACKVLAGATAEASCRVGTVREILDGWSGSSGESGPAMAILLRFRQVLADSLFSAYLHKCRLVDPDFEYGWANFESPLRALLSEQPESVFPFRRDFHDWPGFILGALERAQADLLSMHRLKTLHDLDWLEVHRPNPRYMLSRLFPSTTPLFDAPTHAGGGSLYCVRVASPEHGAAARLVVSPGKEGCGLLHMPGGQSGHPLSRHYSDQHSAWANGERIAFLLEEGREVSLEPAAALSYGSLKASES